MNEHIRRIEVLDAQIKKLDNLQKSETYVGAGLSLEICVGPAHRCKDPINVELVDYESEILHLVKEALLKQRYVRVLWAKQEKQELGKFFEVCEDK